LNGYADCYFTDLPRSDNGWVAAPSEAQEAITKFYRETPNSNTLLISEVFARLPARHVERADPRAQLSKGDHSIYDGNYWRLAFGLGKKPEQIGFVEGYLSCLSATKPDEAARFPRAATDYAALISRWYGFSEKTGDINEDREGEKIAFVLSKFRASPEAAPTKTPRKKAGAGGPPLSLTRMRVPHALGFARDRLFVESAVLFCALGAKGGSR
jgi:hypothetical protein